MSLLERIKAALGRRPNTDPEKVDETVKASRPSRTLGNKGRRPLGTLRRMLKACEESPYYHEKGSNYISIGIGGPQVRALKSPSTQGPPKTTDGGVERK